MASARRSSSAWRSAPGRHTLARGDVIFRSGRTLSDDARARARAAYSRAGGVVLGQGVSADNPAHDPIVRVSRRRRTMIDRRLNFLGMRDSFVPVQRHQFLLELTNLHIAAARDAVQKFVATRRRETISTQPTS